MRIHVKITVTDNKNRLIATVEKMFQIDKGEGNFSLEELGITL